MEESNASVIVDSITKEWLGAVGGVLAILGVIAAPITSGDTAFRSARLIVADFLGLEQKSIRRRLYICVPMFILAIGLLLYSLRDANGFNMIWRYFAWANQTLAVFTLWAITVFLAVSKKPYIITLIPALFMTCVCSTYICIAPEGLRLSHALSYSIGIVCVVVAIAWFCVWLDKQKTKKIIRMKKIKKSTGVALAFLIYVSVTAVYLLPRNTEVSLTEKIITVAVSYVIIFLLWLVLRKKEQMRERRKKDEQSIHLKK